MMKMLKELNWTNKIFLAAVTLGLVWAMTFFFQDFGSTLAILIILVIIWDRINIIYAGQLFINTSQKEILGILKKKKR